MKTFGMEDWQTLIADERVLVTRDILRYNDMDDNGHLNNSVFTVLCESGRVDYFRKRVTPASAGQYLLRDRAHRHRFQGRGPSIRARR